MEPIKGTGPSAEDILRFQVKRNVTLLFKRYLELLDGLIVEHDDALNKMSENLPSEYVTYVSLADHLTDAKADLFRKRVLDAGNETIRNLDEIIKGFNIELK